MSITASLANALTGLAAASRSAQVVSSNVSNALTEGYARREIELSARSVGGVGAGVQIDNIARVVDETLIRERRLASASLGSSEIALSFGQDALGLVGEPQDANSLSAIVANFESALISATSRPDSDARLNGVVVGAQDVTSKLNRMSDGIASLRVDADTRIGLEVDRLNATLEQVAEINGQILRARGTDQDYPALLDNRQQLIDDISELVPIRQMKRDNDTVALYSMNGALLLDTLPANFGFQPTSPITADMTLASGALSGLTINGQPIVASGQNSPIEGGVLFGLFSQRDEYAVSFQEEVDAVARNLISRLESASVDPTLAPGQAGLFTDAGSALDASQTIGLAGRISVNSSAVPAEGGELWRIRDGFGATGPGLVGDASILTNALEAVRERVNTGAGSFTTSEKSLTELVSAVTSLTGQQMFAFENRFSFEQSRYEGLNDAVLAQGVDTDVEMQKLLLIEQAYAANARVIQTVDELIQSLIRL